MEYLQRSHFFDRLVKK